MRLSPLPQLEGGLFLGDGGIETSLIYLDGIYLPEFASFVLLRDDAGRKRLRSYFEPYLEVCAATPGAGFLLDTATCRAAARAPVARALAVATLTKELSQIPSPNWESAGSHNVTCAQGACVFLPSPLCGRGAG
jgi:hypothetical protein